MGEKTLHDEMIIHVKKRQLPNALTRAHEFRELSDVERQEFASRLQYIEEIPKKLAQGLGADRNQDEIGSFIDRVELDLMINLGAHGEGHKGISTWLVHSSWTFGTSAGAMRAALGSEVMALLARFPTGIDADVEEFFSWAASLGECLVGLLDTFYRAETFDVAMGSLLAIDLCLSQLYYGFLAQRLNPRVLWD